MWNQTSEQELHCHLQMLTEENIRAGLSPEEALRSARIELGGTEQVKEQVRENRLGHGLQAVLSDCRFSLRQLRKNPGFTAVAILTLSLGIGATTAIFSVVYGVLLRPLPYPDSDRIMAIFEISSAGNPSRVADPNFDDFRDQNRSFQAVAKYGSDVVSVSGSSEPNAHNGCDCLARFFQDLRRSTSFRPGVPHKRCEKRGGPDRPCQLWVLERIPRLAVGPLAVAPEDQ